MSAYGTVFMSAYGTSASSTGTQRLRMGHRQQPEGDRYGIERLFDLFHEGTYRIIFILRSA